MGAKEYYTVKEVAGIFCVSYNAIRQAMIDGLLDYSKVGGSYRVSVQDLSEYRNKISSRNI